MGNTPGRDTGESHDEPLRRSVEVEYWVIDDTDELTESGPLIDATEGAEREFIEPLLEIKTSPCETTAEMRAELFDRLGAVLRRAEETGRGLVPLATPVGDADIDDHSSDRTAVQSDALERAPRARRLLRPPAPGRRARRRDRGDAGVRTRLPDGRNCLLEGVDDSFTVFASYTDRVAEAPPDATVFARNDYGIHGFRKGGAFGVQFHPEYDVETARSIAEGKRGDVSPERLASVLAGIGKRNYRAARDAASPFDNFLDYVSETRSDAVAAE